MEYCPFQRLVHPYLARQSAFTVAKGYIIQRIGLIIADGKKARVAINKTMASATQTHTAAGRFNGVIVCLQELHYR